MRPTSVTHVRGSTLLLGGKALSSLLSFGTQLLIVRRLTTADYGAFAYALAVVAVVQVFCCLGLQMAVRRFVPIYDEQRQYNKMFGAMVVSAATVMLLSACLLALAYYMPPRLLHYAVRDKHATSFLYMVVPLAGLQALASVLGSILAGLTGARDIFFRIHVLTPALKLAAVLVFALANAHAVFLAYGYIAASGAWLVINIWLLGATLRRRKILQRFDVRALELPVKQMFSFAFPVLSSDLVSNAMIITVAMFFLGRFHTATEVASYRVVVPAALTNLYVITSFFVLYGPIAARRFARHDYDGINSLYWTSTAWITVLSFPVFLLTFALAKPLTILLYGSRYADSGAILSILSFGCFINVILGLNSETLRVFGAVRFILMSNVLTVVIGALLCFFLIPPYGAMGAASATAGTLIFRNVLSHFGLMRATGVRVFDPTYLSFYCAVVVGTLGVYAVQRVSGATVLVSFALVPVTAMGVFISGAHHLQVRSTFPELLNFRLFVLTLEFSERLNHIYSTLLRKVMRGSVAARLAHESAEGSQD